MFAEQALRAAGAPPAALDAGRALVDAGGVTSHVVCRGSIGASVTLAGRVDEGGASYAPQAALDLAQGELIDYACPCPAGQDAPCAHVAALVLHHLATDAQSCRLAGIPEPGARPAPAPAFTFKVGEDSGVVTCLATVAYGDARPFSVYEPSRPGQPARNRAAEYRVADVVETYFPVLGRAPETPRDAPHFDEDDADLMAALLTDGLRELGRLGQVLLSERLAGRRVRTSPTVTVTAAVYGGLLNLKAGASGLTAHELAQFLDAHRRGQRYVRLSDGDIVRIGEGARAADELAQGLGLSARELAQGVGGLPGAQALFVDATLARGGDVRLAGDEGFRAVVHGVEDFADADVRPPRGLAAELRPYQLQGLRWLQTLERLGLGGILADDMGLGKTLQVIAHVLAAKEAGVGGCTLVVCPASLTYNWTAELTRFAPGLRVAEALGPRGRRAEVIGSVAAGGPDAPDVLVTSYDLMRRDAGLYDGVRFRRVVLDEAQHVKNPTTQVARAAKRLRADVRLALTGTPVENRTLELWSIFDFLMPGLLGTRQEFARRFEGAAENREAGAAERLRRMVAPFVLRRLKADVLADLPEKVETVVYARMAGEQDLLYKACQDRLALQIAHELPRELRGDKMQVLAQLTRLRQVCCDPRLYLEDYTGGSAKLETCLELVRQAAGGGHRVLVFSQFAGMLGLIAARLDAEGLRHLTLTGATPRRERARLVDAFQAGGADVFLISLKAGGVGLNLTAADVVIHYDPWWNLAAQDQATDRAHRLGQTRAVSVFKLVCRDTIEERILRMQEGKRDLAQSVLGGEAAASATLTREDLLALLDAREA